MFVLFTSAIRVKHPSQQKSPTSTPCFEQSTCSQTPWFRNESTEPFVGKHRERAKERIEKKAASAMFRNISIYLRCLSSGVLIDRPSPAPPFTATAQGFHLQRAGIEGRLVPGGRMFAKSAKNFN
ncbi:hypothetical protein CEXT_291901 [Caerostris extrusa]|uniref:Uncharacterized protein n=1 Tax=Caerostris extrusa TaxID=172846 RepID=A0AAV4X0M6_CAEEX|nr:hypothetical protein CEXT_291901 [Caerostris extrusa]